MCERTYTACGGCDMPAHEYVRHIEVRYYSEQIIHSIDEDGDVCGDPDYGDAEPSDGSDDWHYSCESCGWTGTELDDECVPDDCECAECDPEIDNYSDPDQIVTLVRSLDRRVTNDPDWPVEVQRLVLDRTIHFVPMRRERAAEIQQEVDFTIGMSTQGYTSDPDKPCLYFNLDPQLADWIIEQLSIPEPEPEDIPVAPNQLELEGGSRVA